MYFETSAIPQEVETDEIIPQGPPGKDGKDGKSAYQIALDNGFEGTEEEWLLSLTGPQGEQGETGPKGDTGEQGPQGETGPQGEQGPQGEPGEDGADGAPATINGLNALTIEAKDGIKATQEGDILTISGKELQNNTGAKTVTDESISVTDSVKYPLLGLSVYGKSTQDGTPSPTNPIPIVSVGDDGELKVQCCGKNLFTRNDNLLSAASPQRLLDIKEVEKGVLQFSTNPEYQPSGVHFPIDEVVALSSAVDGETITLSFDIAADTEQTIQVGIGSQAKGFKISTDWKRYSWTMTAKSGKPIHMQVYADVSVTVKIKNLQIELGSTATDYEPYTGSTASITSALSLCGKDGVYDELIFKPDRTGKAVKHFHKETFDISALNKEVLTNTTLYKTYTEKVSVGSSAAKLCNVSSNYGYHTLDEPHFYVSHIFNMYVANEDVEAFEALGTVTVMYDLATPEEIELTAEGMAQLYKFYSHDGVTNIFNDESAEMSVKYCTSPLMSECYLPFLEKQANEIEELKAAILSAGANV